MSNTTTFDELEDANALTISDAFHVSDIHNYISTVMKIPMLTLEEEQSLGAKVKNENDIEAAHRLVLSHLRLVVSISRKYLGYGLPHADLIQEGNVGLMKAVKRFDPSQGVRLVSYAMHWIKAEMHEYIIKNWRIVKIATTKAQRKLFFNLRTYKNIVKNDEDNDSHRTVLTPLEVSNLANQLNVKVEDVVEMERRFSNADMSIDIETEDDESTYKSSPINFIVDENAAPETIMESAKSDWLASDGIELALNSLDDRSRRIVEARWLHVNDEGHGGATLQELGLEFGVSAERIRQLEVKALKKMRKVLEDHENGN